MALNKDGLEAGQTVDFKTLMKVELGRKNAKQKSEPKPEPDKPKRGRKKSE